jgi:hypothetical protein
MTYAILSARYADESHQTAVIETAEAGSVAISSVDTPAEWAALLEWADAPGNAIAGYVEPPPSVPRIVSRAQGRIALLRAGLLGAAETAIAASVDAELQIWWADAQEFRRDSPRIAAVGTALGLTPAQIDALFVSAATVT